MNDQMIVSRQAREKGIFVYVIVSFFILTANIFN